MLHQMADLPSTVLYRSGILNKSAVQKALRTEAVTSDVPRRVALRVEAHKETDISQYTSSLTPMVYELYNRI